MNIKFGERFKVQMEAATTVELTDDLYNMLANVVGNGLASHILADTKMAWMIEHATPDEELRCQNCGNIHYGAGTDEQCRVAGSWPKRLAAVAWKLYETRLDQSFVAMIGEYARRSIFDGTAYLDVTQIIDWKAGDFGDSHSCFWGDRAYAKNMIFNAGGGALRAFADVDYTKGLSRCWLLPYEDGLVMFNAYGKLRLDQFSRILANQWNLQRSDLECLTNLGESAGKLYINGSTGHYLYDTGPAYKQIDLKIPDRNQRACHQCGEIHDEDDMVELNDNYYCNDCTVVCARCHHTVVRETSITSADTNRTYCPECARHYEMKMCAECGTWHSRTHHHGEVVMTQVGLVWYCPRHTPKGS